MARRFTLLLVDDEPIVLATLQTMFEDAGYRLLSAATGQEALRLADENRIDAALLDLRLPDTNGIDLLGRIRARHRHAMICILTGVGGVREAVQAMRRGAVDFIEKPVDAASLQNRLSQLHQLWMHRQEDLIDRAPVPGFCYHGLVGESEPIRELKSLVTRVSRTDVTALITGETGVGKELVARAIHAQSDRSSGPFVAIDCAAIAESVMESELFGHARGAFTGAHEASMGLFRAAEGGTVFLDEVAELALAMQSKLLRAVQEREVRPVGSTRAHTVNARILAATNRDLMAEVTAGRFREDLYYRLNAVIVPVPPLRERRSDIPMIARHFLLQIEQQGAERSISGDAMRALQMYDWPGNVRELQNAVARAAALADNHEITIDDLPEAVRRGSAPEGAAQGTISSYERRAIAEALQSADGNRRKAARILGIGEATLYRKLRRFGIHG